jgi:hypothetical protein
MCGERTRKRLTLSRVFSAGLLAGVPALQHAITKFLQQLTIAEAVIWAWAL